MKCFLILLVFCLSVQLSAQNISASQLIERSLAVHDPQSQWNTFKDSLIISQSRPDGSNLSRSIFLNNKKHHFSFSALYPEGELQYKVDRKGARYLWNEARDVNDELKKKYRISDTRASMYHNYYSYMYGMPMKLSDPGTHISPNVEKFIFKDKNYLRIKVTYDPEVGDDIWYFYFNPNSHELEMVQFFHDESKNDGEYIYLDGKRYFGQLRLPEKLLWYYNKDDGFLGEDKLVNGRPH